MKNHTQRFFQKNRPLSIAVTHVGPLSTAVTHGVCGTEVLPQGTPADPSGRPIPAHVRSPAASLRSTLMIAWLARQYYTGYTLAMKIDRF